MASPFILLVGPANSGKDTAASIIEKNHNAKAVAMADEMKRFAHKVFDFTETQLWGPSSERNKLDTRFSHPDTREVTRLMVMGTGPDWVRSVLMNPSTKKLLSANDALIVWVKKILAEAALEGGVTPRKVLQTLGSEWGRDYGHRDMWVTLATDIGHRLLGGGYRYTRLKGIEADSSKLGYDFVTITDGRFRNELIAIKRLGGKVFQIRAPDTTGAEAMKAGVQGHASEMEQRGLPQHWFDVSLLNNKAFGMGALEEVLEEAMSYSFYTDTGQTFEPIDHLLEQLGKRPRPEVVETPTS